MITLAITFDPQTGRTKIDGPIHDKLLCYGLLEVGRQMIQTYNPRAAKDGIIPAKMPIIGPNGRPA